MTPTNARGSMDGGFDAAVKRYFGDGIEQRVRREIAARFGGATPVGGATCVSTAGLSAPATGPQPRYLISAPTMSGSSERVSGTLNTALAFGAAIQAARVQNAMEPGSIRTLAVPGLGASTGRVPPETCAGQMLAAYELMRDHAFEDFADMRAALLATLAPLAARSRGAVCGSWARARTGRWSRSPRPPRRGRTGAGFSGSSKALRVLPPGLARGAGLIHSSRVSSGSIRIMWLADNPCTLRGHAA